jgi:glycosyltransferase involved in cell wall biosynthesis
MDVSRMKILWLEPEPSLPPLTGGRERAGRLLDYVSQRHAVHLLTFAVPEDEPGLAGLRTNLTGVTAVPYPSDLKKLSLPMLQAVQVATARFNPDVFQVHGLDLWPYVPSGFRRVLDLYDIPSVLHSQLLAALPAKAFLLRWRQRRIVTRWRRREMIAMTEAAAVIVVSQADRAALLANVDKSAAPAFVVPNGVTWNNWPSASQPPEPATILFPGALNWQPNVEAARVLVTEVLPQVQKQIPGVNIVIAGRLPDPSIIRLAESNTAVTLIANPPDMLPIFTKAAVVVVPLEAASGTRLKILQALAVGRPVVSTPVGAEGFGLENGRHLIIAPLVKPFADALIDLLHDPGRQRQLIAGGQSIIAQFDWDCHLPVLDEVYTAVAGSR